MPAELSPAELADILESGKYTQAKGSLVRSTYDESVRYEISRGYCCLGVYGEECGILNNDGSIYVVGRATSFTSIPEELQPYWMRYTKVVNGVHTNTHNELQRLNDSDDCRNFDLVIRFLRGLHSYDKEDL